jgi:4-aminobutyrate--pyruvate transaminase
MPLSNAQARDVQALLHPYTNLVKLRETGPLVFEKGKGVRVYDEHGKDYIEAMAGLWCTALGWGEEALIEAAAEQMRKLAYGHLFAGRSHEPAIALAEKLKDIAPFPVGKVFFRQFGLRGQRHPGQAVLVRQQFPRPHRKEEDHQPREGISRRDDRSREPHRPSRQPEELRPAARFRALHGLSALITATRRPARASRTSPRVWPGISRLSIVKEGPETIAAMIAEPVQGAGGVILPPEGYFDAICRVLARYGIPLIDDEVITGFGRTGNWFGCGTYGFEPATMTIAKALSSAYVPISAVLISPEICEAIEEESGRIGTFGHGFTYSGHPVAAAVALKTIEIYEQRDIVGHVRHVAPLFLKRLAKLGEHPLVGEAKGIGLIGGIEIVADKKTRRSFEPAKTAAVQIGKFVEEEGVIARPLMGDRIALCPPLVITEAEIGELFDRFERGLDKGLDWAKREGWTE